MENRRVRRYEKISRDPKGYRFSFLSKLFPALMILSYESFDERRETREETTKNNQPLKNKEGRE